MFNCENCGRTTKLKEKQETISTTRIKIYENFRMVFDPKTKRKKRESFETQGYETAAEFKVCSGCKAEGTVDGKNTQRKGRRNSGFKTASEGSKKSSKVRRGSSRAAL